MKFRHYLLISIGAISMISLILSLQGCKKDNVLPTCSITSPSNGTSVPQGIIVTISVDAKDSDGDITEVRFYIDGVGKSTASSFPYNYEWNTANVSVGNHTIKATAYDNEGATQSSDISISISVSSGPTVSNVTNPTTGEIWMDRNLGASQVATSSTDAASYGDLYQWGRSTDGHQIRTSGTTSTLSSTNVPGHTNFIVTSSSPYDWRSPQNTNLWQGVNGVNNPCPATYRIPTEAELNAERNSWSSNNAAGAFASPLKLPMAGYRDDAYGALGSVGSYGYCWSSTLDGVDSRSLHFDSSNALMYSLYRSVGFSVRCIKD